MVAGVRDGAVRTAVEREVWVMVEQFCTLIAVVVATQIYSCGKVAHTRVHTHTRNLVKSDQVLDCTEVHFLACVLLYYGSTR